jgi:hypothetical protein
MELSLASTGFVIQGTFHIIRRRWLLHWLRGCDARQYYSFEHASADVSYFIAGEGSVGSQFGEAAERGVTILQEEELLDPLRIEWSVDDRLVVLRGLLNQPPSDAVWRQICQELELWPTTQGLDIGLSYVAGATRAWPDEVLLRCPLRWLKRAAAHHPDPRMAVVRDLFVQQINIVGKSVAPMMELLPQLRSIHISRANTSWQTPRVGIDAASLKVMLEHPNAAHIKRLVLDNATLGKGCAEVVRKAKLDQLELVSMVGTGYKHADLEGVRKQARVVV